MTCIVNLGCNTGIRELCSTFDCIATFARYNYVFDITKQKTYATQPHPQLHPQPQPHPQLQPQHQPNNALARMSNRPTNYTVCFFCNANIPQLTFFLLAHCVCEPESGLERWAGSLRLCIQYRIPTCTCTCTCTGGYQLEKQSRDHLNSAPRPAQPGIMHTLIS